MKLMPVRSVLVTRPTEPPSKPDEEAGRAPLFQPGQGNQALRLQLGDLLVVHGLPDRPDSVVVTKIGQGGDVFETYAPVKTQEARNVGGRITRILSGLAAAGSFVAKYPVPTLTTVALTARQLQSVFGLPNVPERVVKYLATEAARGIVSTTASAATSKWSLGFFGSLALSRYSHLIGQRIKTSATVVLGAFAPLLMLHAQRRHHP